MAGRKVTTMDWDQALLSPSGVSALAQTMRKKVHRSTVVRAIESGALRAVPVEGDGEGITTWATTRDEALRWITTK